MQRKIVGFTTRGLFRLNKF